MGSGFLYAGRKRIAKAKQLRFGCNAVDPAAARCMSPNAEISGGRKLQSDDAGNDQRDTGQAHRIGRFVKQEDAEYDGAHGADSDPDCISGADRQRFHGDAQQAQADDHGNDGGDARPKAAETLRVFQPDGPGHFKHAGNQQYRPVHSGSHRRVRSGCAEMRARSRLFVGGKELPGRFALGKRPLLAIDG